MSEYIHGPLGAAVSRGDSVLVKGEREPRLPWNVYANDGRVATLERPGFRIRRLCDDLEPVPSFVAVTPTQEGDTK